METNTEQAQINNPQNRMGEGYHSRDYRCRKEHGENYQAQCI